MEQSKSKPVAIRKKRREVPQHPQPIPPIESVTAGLIEALDLISRAERSCRRAGRLADANYLQTTISDIEYRHLVRVRQTACTHCTGYRDAGPILGWKCRCTATVGITGANDPPEPSA